MYTNSEDYKEERNQFFSELILSRGHEFVSGSYNDKKSELIVYCPIHEETHVASFTNYKRSKTGLPCCGKARKSVLLTGREYSPKTIEKMRVAARNRPRKPDTGKFWRDTSWYKDWRIAVREDWGFVCAITGQKGDLDVHHLYNGSAFEENRYNPGNGVLLDTRFHKLFHDNYGYHNNTLEMFIDFLGKLINNQVQLESCEGLETRTYDPERVIESHERLAQLLADKSW
jgi:hypothetical protein